MNITEIEKVILDVTKKYGCNSLSSINYQFDDIIKCNVELDCDINNRYANEMLKQTFNTKLKDKFTLTIAGFYDILYNIKHEICDALKLHNFILSNESVIPNQLKVQSKTIDTVILYFEENVEIEKSNQKFDDLNCISTNSVNDKEQSDMKKVFIIHGHDEAMESKVESFILKLGLEAIILHKQANKGQTIIEKLMENTENADFAIALYSPDDSMQDSSKRARQNVVFEHGLLIGLLGRKKVVALNKKCENFELPSDISGVVYIEYDAKGSWQYDIAKEMEQVGFEIDLNKI